MLSESILIKLQLPDEAFVEYGGMHQVCLFAFFPSSSLLGTFLFPLLFCSFLLTVILEIEFYGGHVDLGTNPISSSRRAKL